MQRVLPCLAVLLAMTALATTVMAQSPIPRIPGNPYDLQVKGQVERLASRELSVRAAAAESLGFLRAYSAANALVDALDDEASSVRRDAALALSWCGGRTEVESLLAVLDDRDAGVRQAAWSALTNLTGMEFPFDGTADASARGAQVKRWSVWRQGIPDQAPPAEVLELTRSASLEHRLRGVRAIGALGGDGTAEEVIRVARPLLGRPYDSLDPLEKHLVQSCLRSLGRLGDPGGQTLLIDLIGSPGWTRYAADALGDFGGDRAVSRLIEVYPSFSRDLVDRRGKGNLHNPPICPEDDRFSGNNTQDRMHETPFAIAAALVRLPLDDPANIEGLRRMAPYLLSNLPSDWDSGVLYEPEAYELVTAYLLEKAGLRQVVTEAAFQAASEYDTWAARPRDDFTGEEATPEECLQVLARRMFGDVPYMARWLPALCRDQHHVGRLIELLQHENGWIRINAAKTLMFVGAEEAIEPLGNLLKQTRPEAEYGYSGALEHAEYNSPAPRWREAYIRALGRLDARRHDQLLISLMQDERNVLEIQYAASLALDELGTPSALEALGRANRSHPFHSVRLVAREALWRRGLTTARTTPLQHATVPTKLARERESMPEGMPEAIVFIQGENDCGSDFNGQAGIDPWRQTYSITNSGPAYRRGRNLFLLSPPRPDGQVTPLTHFRDGFVADCEVSFDGNRVIFARRNNGDERNYTEVPYQEATLKQSGEALWGGADDPWWHIWEINVDGTGLKQLTFGPYHDVGPAYLPDGRVVFTSSRLGLRDEYHGYPSTGLAVMNHDGSDIHTIGFNLGGDREPAVLDDGRIVFSRLDNFYSRLKTEMTLQTAMPDGTRNVAFYGPERRAFWRDTHVLNAAWTLRPSYGDNPDNRNRVLRLTQPQPFGDGRVVCASSGGLALVGPQRFRETLIPHDRKMAVTSPYPLSNGQILCAATLKQFEIDGRLVTGGTAEFKKLEKGPQLFKSAVNIDLGLYLVDARTGHMELIYNDPLRAEFEPRPIIPRRRPHVIAENPTVRTDAYTARLFCNSAMISRESRTGSRGQLIRVIEGMPIVARHETQQNQPTNRWKNHGGTHARILGTAPLAADGSFHVEVPADRLIHLQVLDSDRRVVGNQLFWMYARPGETRSCAGCHEDPDTRVDSFDLPPAMTTPPIVMLPTGGEFTYRAKAWLKGTLPDEAEERNRTVRAVSLMGRY